MAKGVRIKFLSRTVVFYPLTIGQIQDHPEEIKTLTKAIKNPEDAFDPKRFGVLIKLHTMSAQRGDPSITEDDIRKIVDMGNIAEVNAAVLGQSGLLAEEGASPSSDPTSPPIGG